MLEFLLGGLKVWKMLDLDIQICVVEINILHVQLIEIEGFVFIVLFLDHSGV